MEKILRNILSFSLMAIGFLFFLQDSSALENKKGFDPSPIHLTADELGKKKNKLTGKGNVEVKYKDYSIKADNIELNIKTGNGSAYNNVNMYDESTESNIECDSTDFNIKSKKGIVYNGKGVLAKEYFYSGDRFELVDKNTYIINNASLTTCDGSAPINWKLKSKKATVHIDGYAYLSHTTFWIKKTPVFYLPYLVVPVRTKRATGLLFPYIGSSDRNGNFIYNSFFWAINEHSDATLYLDYMTKKGVRPGIEYRYTPDNNISGQITSNFIKEKNTGKEFWNLNVDHKQKFTSLFDNITILDIASRNNPEKEFSDDTTLRTKRYRDSYTSFIKSWGNDTLQFQLRYRRSIEEGVDEKNYQFPEISFERYQARISNSSVYFNLGAKYTLFINEKDNKSVGIHRLDINPSVLFPFTLFPYLAFTPSVGFRETLYTKGKDENGVITGTFLRELFDLNLELKGPNIYKVFYNGNQNEKYKHLIEPFITYNYVSNIDKRDSSLVWYQSNNGEKVTGFDSIDIIKPENKVSFSLFNRFFKKKKKITSEVFRLEVKNSYYLNKELQKPFSNISLDLDSSVYSPFILNLDGEYDVYKKKIHSANIQTGLEIRGWGKTFWVLAIERRSVENTSAFWTGDVSVKYKNLHLKYLARYDEIWKKLLENNYSFKYVSQCFEVSVDFLDRLLFLDGNNMQREYKFFVLFTLKGIGSFGKKRSR